VDDFQYVFIPMLRSLITPDTARPLYRTLRDRILFQIFSVPGLVESLVRMEFLSFANEAAISILSQFLLAVAKAFVEVRKSEGIAVLTEQLQAQHGNMSGVNALCALVLVDKKSEATNDVESTTENPPMDHIPWVTDLRPPGDRHDNDELNYRNIQIVPTIAELICQDPPYLPLASGQNYVLEEPVNRLLDRNFRLLREDAVSTMRTNILEQNRPWKNARVVGLNLDTFRLKMNGTASFIIQCDGRAEKSDWSRSRSFMPDSVVALCRDNIPIRIGTISIRDSEVAGEWLKAVGGPKFGIVFHSQDAFDDSMLEMLRNQHSNAELCSIHGKDSQEARTEANRLKASMVTYDLIEASKSFFSYKPVLRTLQGMTGVPLREEIVLSTSIGAPAYLPEELKMPDDENFRGFTCDCLNWSISDIENGTSLDSSQAEAIRHVFSSRVSLVQGPPGTGT